MLCPCKSLPGPSKNGSAPDEGNLAKTESLIVVVAKAAIDEGSALPWLNFALTGFRAVASASSVLEPPRSRAGLLVPVWLQPSLAKQTC